MTISRAVSTYFPEFGRRMPREERRRSRVGTTRRKETCLLVQVKTV